MDLISRHRYLSAQIYAVSTATRATSEQRAATEARAADDRARPVAAA